MYAQYAADPQMRLNVGIRRRLAPLMENSRPRIELMNSLLFSMPGTPIIYYGDEIGMGDNVYLGDRNGVRTPMQWSSDRNAGFSRADPARLYFPVIMDPVYGYEAINVEAQERSPFSLLHWMKRMIALRRQHPVFGRGSIEFIRTDNRKVLTYVRRYEKRHRPVRRQPVARRSSRSQIPLAQFAGLTPVEMLGQTRVAADRRAAVLPDAGAVRLLLVPAAGGRRADDDARTAPVVDEHPARAGAVRRRRLGLHRSTAACAASSSGRRSCRSCSGSAGSAARRGPSRRRSFVDWATLRRGAHPAFLSHRRVALPRRRTRALRAAAGDGERRRGRRHRAASTATRSLARITGARKGLLYDGLFDDGRVRPAARRRCGGSGAIADAPRTDSRRRATRRRVDRARISGADHADSRERAGSEQHVGALRLAADHEDVPPPRTRGESGRRDRRVPDVARLQRACRRSWAR